jgi:CspA family cold shock protein
MYGVVKWFNSDKGFGFICPQDNGQDIFVHKNDIEDELILIDGQHVEFDLETGPKGPKAKHVRVVPR